MVLLILVNYSSRSKLADGKPNHFKRSLLAVQDSHAGIDPRSSLPVYDTPIEMILFFIVLHEGIAPPKDVKQFRLPFAKLYQIIAGCASSIWYF